MPKSNDEQQLQADIVHAKSAWATKAVTSAARSDSNNILTPAIITNPSQTLAVVEIDKGIRKYWKAEGSRFSSVWRGIDAKSRRNLLLAIDPDLATPNSAQKFLVPELILDDFVNDTDSFLDFIRIRILADDLATQYNRDATVVKGFLSIGKLQADASKADLIAILNGGSHVGEPMEVDREKLQTVDPSLAEKFTAMIQDGVAMEGPIFEHVLERRHMLLQLVALVMDEMRSSVFHEAVSAPRCARPSCKNTNFADTEEDGRPTTGPLRNCQRCLRVAYCSRDCQGKDWKPNHKAHCTSSSSSTVAKVISDKQDV